MKIRKKSKQEQGITLVALVVTIIVLLILAGVTISAVLGENGLVQKAKRATQVHQNAVITENTEMNNAANFINTIANNDSQADEEDEGEWWIPTEAELAELQAANAVTEEFGVTVGLNVDPASASAPSNGTKVKGITIVYQESIPNNYQIQFCEVTVGSNSATIRFSDNRTVTAFYGSSTATSAVQTPYIDIPNSMAYSMTLKTFVIIINTI